MGLTQLITMNEVAAHFDVTNETVRGCVDKGDLAFVNLGTAKHRIMRFTAEQIENFVKGRARLCTSTNVTDHLTGGGVGRRQAPQKSFAEAVVHLTSKKQNATQ